MMAGRVMIERIKNHIESKKSFAFETTCAAPPSHSHVNACAMRAIASISSFLVAFAEMAVHRVAQRIRQGGHATQEDTIRRRYAAGLRNLIELYLPMADKALIINNTEKNATSEREFAIIAKKESGGRFTVIIKMNGTRSTSLPKEGALTKAASDSFCDRVLLGLREGPRRRCRKGETNEILCLSLARRKDR
jgi:predicted ABC-type ATPase